MGSNIYLAMTMRPDLAFAPHLLSRFLNKHSLFTGRRPEDVDITYWRNCEAHLTGYSDADYPSCKDDRKSVNGYCFSYRSCKISWLATKQTCVSTSTTEADVHALSEAVNEALHLQGILECTGEMKNS